MGFREFIGNETVVRRLRETVAAGRVPQAMILAGARGSGKYTLALMFARLVNCLEPAESDGLPDYCGRCRNCERIGESEDLNARMAEAVAAREDLRETDKRETRILVQTHPDVMVIPPDPPQMLIKVGQVRQVIHNAYYRPPSEGRRAVFIFTSSALMKEAANSLLKVMEEPPAHCTLMLLSENPAELLPTIRSRAVLHRLHAAPTETLEVLLAERRRDLKPAQRTLVAHLAEGAVGRALGFDLEAWTASRSDALVVLRTALRQPDDSALFRMTESYRAGADGQAKTQGLLRALHSLVEDLLLAHAGAGNLMRNRDLTTELEAMAHGIDMEWLERAGREMHAVDAGMRRNLLRSLSLDAMAAGMTKA